MDWPLFRRIQHNESKNNQPEAVVASAISAPGGDSDSELPWLLDEFLGYIEEKRLTLYPAQEEAILELFAGKNVILNTPTGSGKSLVALALHFYSLAHKRRSYYTCPIKALVNEKFFSLCKDFGPDQVGMITGDATVNPGAPIICCTAEILAIEALRFGKEAALNDVIMDEFHYYADRERGVAWQVPLLLLPQVRFLLMSATLGDTSPFEKALTALNHRETSVVFSNTRPVPLDFEYSEIPLFEIVPKLLERGRAPIYLVNFTQRECAEEAQNFLSIDLCTKDEKKSIALALAGVKFSSPYGKEFQKLLRHGLGIHHAGLLPRYRILVEKLAQQGLLKIIFGTDTLGVGVNVPIRTVLFTKLCKFDGEKTVLLSIRDFLQISGRAGRKGFDDRGTVVVQAPEHVIENLRNEQKAAGDPKKLKKIVKRKPPEKGYLPWNRETFVRLSTGQPEALISRFKVTHSMLLHVLGRPNEAGCKVMKSLIRTCHETAENKKKLRKSSFQLFRSLVSRKIIEFNPLRVNINLQEDFSLNQTLALYLLDTLKLLDPKHPDFALDLLSLAESILEDPELILRKQLDRIKSEKLQELKLAGMEYEERIAELEKLEYPKPNREFIYNTFNDFSAKHPWVGQDNIQPKSIARELYETYQSFAEYIRDYELQRAEGLLLRYLSELYKVLVQTIPSDVKTEEFEMIVTYFGSMLRQIDSSLIDEWDRLRRESGVELPLLAAEGLLDDVEERGPVDITKDRRAFTILARNEIFRLLRALASYDFEETLAILEPVPAENEAPWTIDRLESLLKEYEASGHSRIRTDTKARGSHYTVFLPDAENASNDITCQKIWKIQQILVDPEDHCDWALNLQIDLEASRSLSRPVIHLTGIGEL